MNHTRTSALIEHIRQRDGQVGVNLGNATEEWVKLARELEDELAEMKALICLAVDCGEACGMDGAYPEAWEQMKAVAVNGSALSSIQPADAIAVIADLLANAVPVAAESGDAGMVFVEMTEAQWQAVVDATARARAFLAK